jgi:hypothetical protein
MLLEIHDARAACAPRRRIIKTSIRSRNGNRKGTKVVVQLINEKRRLIRIQGQH